MSMLNIKRSSGSCSIVCIKSSKSKAQSLPPYDLSKFLATNISILCPWCKRIIENAHQADDCGCCFCLKCLDEFLSIKQSETKCPKCNLVLASKFKITDNFFQKKINETIIDCISCDWRGPIKDYTHHYNTHSKVVAVENMCKSELISDISNKECEYKMYGCTFTNYNDSFSLETHYEKALAFHLNAIYIFYEKQINSINYLLFNDVDKSKEEEEEEKKLTLVTHYCDKSELNLFVKRQKSDETDLNNSNEENSSLIEINLNLFETKLKPLETNAKMLNDDLLRVYKGNKKLYEENRQLKQCKHDLEIACLDLQKLLAQSQLSMLKLEERIAQLDKTVKNGVIVWRINDYSQRNVDPIYSPAFYTSEINGYRVCAKLYLNGDGKGLNTHLSIYLIVLKGDFDALASWPFQLKSSFTLMDQSEHVDSNNSNNKTQRCHITETIMPDVASHPASFRRPQFEMNVPSGLSQFVPIEVLTNRKLNYLKMNTLFIKICVGV